MSAEKIIDTVIGYYNLEKEDVFKRCRKREFVWARFMAAYFLRNNTQLYLREISELLKMRDHSSVIHSIQAVNDQLSLKHVNWAKEDVEILKERLKN